jgi:hypothetical protein
MLLPLKDKKGIISPKRRYSTEVFNTRSFWIDWDIDFERTDFHGPVGPSDPGVSADGVGDPQNPRIPQITI